jgi:hypothetical protein
MPEHTLTVILETLKDSAAEYESLAEWGLSDAEDDRRRLRAIRDAIRVVENQLIPF